MKYLLSLILVPVLAAFCVGCGSAPEQSTPAPAAEAEAETAAEEVAEVLSQGAEAEPPSTKTDLQAEIDETEETNMEKALHLSVNGRVLAVDWEDNESVLALKELVSSEPLTVQMSMYGGFEQVGSLGTDLPRNDSRTTTQAGDIVLYSGNQIVIFYGSNSWAYTRLGRITDQSTAEMKDLLGSGDVTVTLSWE